MREMDIFMVRLGARWRGEGVKRGELRGGKGEEGYMDMIATERNTCGIVLRVF
jgi:hypothetical protein